MNDHSTYSMLRLSFIATRELSVFVSFTWIWVRNAFFKTEIGAVLFLSGVGVPIRALAKPVFRIRNRTDLHSLVIGIQRRAWDAQIKIKTKNLWLDFTYFWRLPIRTRRPITEIQNLTKVFQSSSSSSVADPGSWDPNFSIPVLDKKGTRSATVIYRYRKVPDSA